MTGKGTKRHVFRIPDEVWLPAQAEAERRGETVTDVVRRALIKYATEDNETQTEEETS